MQKIKRFFNYFTLIEKLIWCFSALLITAFFCIFDRIHYLNFISSIFGITAIMLNAKGNPFGQCIMVVFAIFYGIISLSYKYYGELITYVFMTLPMSILSLISWLKHRFNGKKLEVKVGAITKKELPIMIGLTISITIAFYFILGAFNTNNLIISTLSVSTSFLAVYCSFRRSEMFSFFYCLNDIVLIILWILATLDDLTYISIVICFVAFLLNDSYSFINWKKLKKSQEKILESQKS